MKDWRERIAKMKQTSLPLTTRLADLNKIIEDPNHNSGKVISDGKAEAARIQQKLIPMYESPAEPAGPLTHVVLTEMLNLNAFGQCCANSSCKQAMYEQKKINMQYDSKDKSSKDNIKGSK